MSKKGKGRKGDWVGLEAYKSSGKRCYHSHKPLKVGQHTVTGGSATEVPPESDVVVRLDGTAQDTPRAFPWTPGVEVTFPITDGAAPKDAGQFKAMIAWLAEQVAAGVPVHVGCMGGHGRTGLVLAALVAHVHGDEDAIGYVREHYCKKAVETAEQVRFLVKHFGVKDAKGSRSTGAYGSPVSRGSSWDSPDWNKVIPFSPAASTDAKTMRITPLDRPFCIHGDNEKTV